MGLIYEKDIGLARDSSGGDQTNILIFVGYFKLWTGAHNPVLPGGGVGLHAGGLWTSHKAVTGGSEATAAPRPGALIIVRRVGCSPCS